MNKTTTSTIRINMEPSGEKNALTINQLGGEGWTLSSVDSTEMEFCKLIELPIVEEGGGLKRGRKPKTSPPGEEPAGPVDPGMVRVKRKDGSIFTRKKRGPGKKKRRK